MVAGGKTGRIKMKQFFANRWFLLLVRLVLGAIFLYAGATKIADPQVFADSIASFRVVPTQLIGLLALGLPPMEVLLGLMLILGWRVRSAAFCVGMLTVVFAIALGQALARGLEVDCGCFGAGQPSRFKTWMSLGRDLVLMVGAAWLYITEANRVEKTT